MRPGWWGTDYAAYTYQNGGGPIYPTPPLSTTALLTVADSTAHNFANGTILDFHITIPASYATQTGTYGNNWWKMYYNLSGGIADDTTTWEIVSSSAPVHLISN